GGAAALTCYETTGWRGVMAAEDGPPAPAKFPSVPGGVFPMYHVFADLGEFAGGDVLAVMASAPLAVDGIAVRKGERLRALLANFTPRPQTVSVRGLVGTVSIKVLDETSVERAMSDPETFRAEPGQEARPASDGLLVTLRPYAITRIDGVAL